MQFQFASFQLHLTTHKFCQALDMQMKLKELELELEACCNMVGRIPKVGYDDVLNKLWKLPSWNASIHIIVVELEDH